jgi:hypothetical protein
MLIWPTKIPRNENTQKCYDKIFDNTNYSFGACILVPFPATPIEAFVRNLAMNYTYYGDSRACA